MGQYHFSQIIHALNIKVKNANNLKFIKVFFVLVVRKTDANNLNVEQLLKCKQEIQGIVQRMKIDNQICEEQAE